MAIAAIMPMIATTIQRSSIKEKPSCFPFRIHFRSLIKAGVVVVKLCCNPLGVVAIFNLERKSEGAGLDSALAKTSQLLP